MAHLSARRTASRSGLQAYWGLTLTLGRPPKGPLPRVLAPQRQGLGTPKPQHLIHPATPLPCRPLRAQPVIQGGNTGTALQDPGTFDGPPGQNAAAHAPARQCPHLGPPLCSLHSQQIRPAGILGANTNPRLTPKGPFLRGLVPPTPGIGKSEPQRWTIPAAPPPPRPLGAPPVIQGGRKGRALRTPVTFKGPRSKALGPTLLLASALTSTRPSAHRIAGGSGLPAS